MAYEIRMPQLGLTMTEGTVGKWLKKIGDPVKKGEPIVEITTDKLTSEVESEFDGVLLAIAAQEGEDVKVQGLLGCVGQPGEKTDVKAAESGESSSAAPQSAVPAANTAVPAGTPAGARIKASPLAKKTAQKLGVNLEPIAGTGPGGRIRQQDVIGAKNSNNRLPDAGKPVSADEPAAESGPCAAGNPFPVKNLELMEGDTVTKMTGMRRVVAVRMYTSAAEIPAVTQNMKVDVTALMTFRRQINEGREKKFSVNDFILKAIAKALRQSPEILVSIDGDRIIRRAHVNLGMAVALDQGLIVPVIRDADRLGLEELSARANDLATRAREGRLGADEYVGSTFTVTNLGMFGVETFTPIINQPDAAILGINCIQDELKMEEGGTIAKHQVMRISLTLDHRLIDGAVAAKFKQSVKYLLEHPMDFVF